MKKITAIQELVEFYKKIRGYDMIEDWDKLNFARHVRGAKQLLDACKSLSEAKQALITLSKYFKDKKLDYVLETIIRRYPDLVAHNLRDSNDKAIYYHPFESKQDIEQRKKQLEQIAKLKESTLIKFAKKENIHDDDEIEE